MSALVFAGSIWNSLKETLNTVVDDDTDGFESKASYPKWVDEKTMKDHWVEDLEMGGPGLAAETPEGTDIPMGVRSEGYIKRYTARKIALGMMVTEEALEDKKYTEALLIARRLKRSLYKTIDIDATDMLVNMFDTNYTGGDGLPLASASHTLANGGTWSNIMATPIAPSRIALIVAVSQLMKFPDHAGIIDGVAGVRVLCPTEQWAVWRGIIESSHAPEPGAFNEINVMNGDGEGALQGPRKVLPIKWWNNTSTNWAVQTDADNGFKLFWRRKPTSKTWVANSNEVAYYSISTRIDTGWSDARCVLGVQA